MVKIMIVEDEQSIADIIAFNLNKEGYEVECVNRGDTAIKRCYVNPPQLMVLDLMLPGADGLEVCKKVREKFQFPIIMLTAKDSEIDKVLGLELGADDYMTKPFSNRELIARIKANLRRATNKQENSPVNTLILGDLSMNTSSFTVEKNGKEIDVTNKEFELLYYLIKNKNKVLSREELLRHVWDHEYISDVRTVDVTIRRLREKIEEEPKSPKYIHTKRGVGYIVK